MLRDVLGPGNAPAAYLLVAVDLILSHWPASRHAAAPFLGCPELLAIDCQRWSHDVTPVPDVFGLGNLQREPRGQATLQSLKQRPSRRARLHERLPALVLEGPDDVRQRVAQLLREAAARLGPYGEDDDLGDSSLMAVHAGNLLVRKNYTDVEVPLRDDRTVVGKQYVAPEPERRHMERLQSARSDRSTDVSLQLAISPEFAASAAEWAQRRAVPQADGEENESGLQQQAVVGAAMIAMRDLTGEQRTRYRSWAMGAFSAAVQGEDDPVTRAREGLRFNPTAIAFAGIAYAMAAGAAREEAAALLALVHRPAAAHGFIAAASAVGAANDRLPQAIVTLNLLEVAPRPAHLSFLLAAASGWLAAFPDATDFWTGHGIGRRVCALIDAVRQTEPTLLASGEPLRNQVDRLLPGRVRVGVADAVRLEQALQPDARRTW